jgi:hypothetical protein
MLDRSATEINELVPSPGLAAEEPLQFDLKNLLCLQAVCALFLGLLIVVGVFAVVIAFLLTLLYCFTSFGGQQLRLKRWMIDWLGGIVMPCLCLLYDPGFLRPDRAHPIFRPEAAGFVYLLLLTQMLVLLAWLVGARRLTLLRPMFAGALFLGAAIALIVGILMLPMTALGSIFFLVGTLGLVPFLTFYVFFTKGMAALRSAKRGFRSVCLAILGLVLAVVGPALLWFALGDVGPRLLNSIPFPSSHVPVLDPALKRPPVGRVARAACQPVGISLSALAVQAASGTQPEIHALT